MFIGEHHRCRLDDVTATRDADRRGFAPFDFSEFRRPPELLKGGESREELKALGRCSAPLPRAGSAHTSEQAVSAVGCRSTGLRWSPLALGRNALRNRGCAYFLFPPTHPVSCRRSFGLRSSLVQKFEGVFRRWSCGEPRRARELHKGRASARATPRTAVQFTSPASCPSALKAIN